jgi:hypothetical protein
LLAHRAAVAVCRGLGCVCVLPAPSCSTQHRLGRKEPSVLGPAAHLLAGPVASEPRAADPVREAFVFVALAGCGRAGPARADDRCDVVWRVGVCPVQAGVVLACCGMMTGANQSNPDFRVALAVGPHHVGNGGPGRRTRIGWLVFVRRRKNEEGAGATRTRARTKKKTGLQILLPLQYIYSIPNACP